MLTGRIAGSFRGLSCVFEDRKTGRDGTVSAGASSSSVPQPNRHASFATLVTSQSLMLGFGNSFANIYLKLISFSMQANAIHL